MYQELDDRKNPGNTWRDREIEPPVSFFIEKIISYLAKQNAPRAIYLSLKFRNTIFSYISALSFDLLSCNNCLYQMFMFVN